MVIFWLFLTNRFHCLHQCAVHLLLGPNLRSLTSIRPSKHPRLPGNMFSVGCLLRVFRERLGHRCEGSFRRSASCPTASSMDPHPHPDHLSGYTGELPQQIAGRV